MSHIPVTLIGYRPDWEPRQPVFFEPEKLESPFGGRPSYGLRLCEECGCEYKALVKNQRACKATCQNRISIRRKKADRDAKKASLRMRP